MAIIKKILVSLFIFGIFLTPHFVLPVSAEESKPFGLFKFIINPVKDEDGKISQPSTVDDRNVKIQIFSLGKARWMKVFNGSKELPGETKCQLIKCQLMPFSYNFDWDICKNITNCIDGKYIVNIKFYDDDMNESALYTTTINLKQPSNDPPQGMVVTIVKGMIGAGMIKVFSVLAIIIGLVYLLFIYDFKKIGGGLGKKK